MHSDWPKTHVLSGYKRKKERKSMCYCFAHVLHCDKTLGHLRNVQNTRLWLMFCAFPLCSQMPVVFYQSVIHGLGFFIC